MNCRDLVATAMLCASLPLVSPVYGNAFPPELPLSGLADSSSGFVINGIDAGDNTGDAVSDAGDVNGDGIGDFIIGASDVFQSGSRGIECYVVFGRTDGFPPAFELSSLQQDAGGDGSAGFIIHGMLSNSPSMAAVNAAGDVNGDGIDDIILGADDDGPQRNGEAYVVFGSSSGFPPEIDLSSFLAANGGDGSVGFVMRGVDLFDEAGRSVSGGVDINGDGVHDLVVGAPQAEVGPLTSSGQTYLIYGNDQGFSPEIEFSSLFTSAGGDGTVGTVVLGHNAGDLSARSVSGAGDINGDGLGDIIIGAPLADPGGQDAAGKVYVVFGRTGGLGAEIELSSLQPQSGGDGSAGFVINGVDVEDRIGIWVSAAGDVNGDGIEDVVFGSWRDAQFGPPGPGRAYLLFGSDQPFSPEFGVESLFDANGGDGSVGVVFHGIAQDDFAGFAISAAGDVNDDGYDDVLVNAAGAFLGEVYVIYGASDFVAEFQLSSLLEVNGGDGDDGFVIAGDDFDTSLIGRELDTAGDVNGDGVADIVIGAANADVDGRQSVGQTFVVFGRRDTDGDDVADALDNCLLLQNPSQLDTNMDGIGNACDADIAPVPVNDCLVNFADFSALRNAFFSVPTDAAWNADADFNGDEAVNFLDLLVMRTQLFTAPGPSGRINDCD